MRSVTPFKIWLSIISLLVIMLAISAVYPEDGLVEVAGIDLKFPSFSEVVHPKQAVQKTAAVENILAAIDTSLFVKEDSVIQAENTIDTAAILKKVEERINLQVVQYLEFGEQGAGVLYPFFENLKKGGSIRILHYGDSQIEGDRMTGFLRQKLQSQFGGSGVGLIIPSTIYNTNAYKVGLSPEWKRFTGFANVNPAVKHKKYGVMAAFSRFTDIVPDSLIRQQPVTEAWIDVGPSRAAYGNAQSFSRARLFYGNCRDSVLLKVFSGGNEIYSSLLIADGNYHEVSLQVNSPSLLRYVFKGRSSPDIYAFSLDGGGVMVDNIALRGASGTFFNRFDQSLQKRMFDDLGVDVFILQFGGNTVPYIEDEKEIFNYGNWLEAQMRNLKKIRPGVSIIVIGPSDMATKQGESFVTYPVLPKLVEAMKQAAFDAGAAYWDMYAAMGGENSMSGWVEKKLAGDDYTHFSPEGAKYIIQMFYEALMYEYYQYEDQQQPEK